MGTERPVIGATVELDFPFANSSVVEATIEALHPVSPKSEAGGQLSDLTVLRLTKPVGIQPCLLATKGPEAGTAFSAYGFPTGQPNGAPAEGELQPPDARGWLAAIATQEFGHFLSPGFSGTPTFRGLLKEVSARGQAGDGVISEFIGLAVTADADLKSRSGRLISSRADRSRLTRGRETVPGVTAVRGGRFAVLPWPGCA